MDSTVILAYLLACPICWYLLSAINYGFNSGQLGRHPLFFPFQCFAEEIKCYWFGGQKYRIEFIQSRCNGNGTMCGSNRSYDFEEIKNNNLYEEVFWQMCGGRISFWGGHFLAFFFGPFFVSIFLLAGAVGAFINLLIFWPIDKIFGTHLVR